MSTDSPERLVEGNSQTLSFLLQDSGYLIPSFLDWTKERGFLTSHIHGDCSVLDIGCASGLLLQCLSCWSEYKLEVFGIDRREHAIDVARNLFSDTPGNNFHVHDLWNIDKLSKTGQIRFDYVIAGWFDDWECNDLELNIIEEYLKCVQHQLLLTFYGPNFETVQSRMNLVESHFSHLAAKQYLYEPVGLLSIGNSKTDVGTFRIPHCVPAELSKHVDSEIAKDYADTVSKITSNPLLIETFCRLALGLRKQAHVVTKSPVEAVQILGICASLNLYFRAKEKDGYYKFICGHSKVEVEAANRLNEEVCLGLKVDKAVMTTFGKFLGYPGCCIEAFVSAENLKGIRNPLGHSISKFSPWPSTLNTFAGVLDYVPCSNTCPNSIKIGLTSLRLREWLSEFCGCQYPAGNLVLHFGQNLWTLFRANKVSPSSWNICSVEIQAEDPHLEKGDISLEFERQAEFLAAIGPKSILRHTDFGLSVESETGKEILEFQSADVSDGLLIEFGK